MKSMPKRSEPRQQAMKPVIKTQSKPTTEIAVGEAFVQFTAVTERPFGDVAIVIKGKNSNGSSE
jgi:hypothetical protein